MVTHSNILVQFCTLDLYCESDHVLYICEVMRIPYYNLRSLFNLDPYTHTVSTVHGVLKARILKWLMAPHSSTLAWKIPLAEEPSGLQSMGSRRVGHD